MTNRSGEIGDPSGTPTEKGVKRRGDPWNVRRQVRSLRKEPTHWTRYGLTPFPCRRERSEGDSSLSKPPFTSRKRVETLYRRLWKDSTLCCRTRAALAVDLPGRDLHGRG